MKTFLVATVTTLLLSSCAHNFMRGTVAMKTDNKTAHVCLGNNDVKVGDKLDFYSNHCTGYVGGRDEGGDVRECKMKVLGTGTVTKLLNSHYSEVKTDGSFKLAEGTLVQKQK
ncbi:MAG: hypothetical protein QF441_10125 [Bacteriovoracaceae bacterium]|jgi:hypothetical protein|nr:hypothetical protein [Bacteriovoracaceae bacterium]|tara:strand:- start:434 stop:772 length:339 start_codon:yes stop_codon:yes gene_type:complete